MNQTYLPPHPKAVEDLLSLLSIVTNPKAVSEYTKGLLEAARQYKEASRGFIDKDASLVAREAAAFDLNAKLVAYESGLKAREKEIERLESDLADKTAKVSGDRSLLDDLYVQYNTERDKLDHDRANFEQTSKSALAALAERDRALKSAHEEHQTKVKALKDLIHV